MIARTEPGAWAREQPAYFSFYRKQQKTDVRRFFLFPIEARFSPGPSGRGFPAVYARSADRLQALLGGTPTTARRGSGPPPPTAPLPFPEAPEIAADVSTALRQPLTSGGGQGSAVRAARGYKPRVAFVSLPEFPPAVPFCVPLPSRGPD